MENFRAFDESADFAGDDEPAMEAPPEIGVDERRMHVRAYNYWVSLLSGRPYPSIRELEPQNLDDFGPHSVLLDFTAGSENPAVPFIGRALRQECQLNGEVRTIADVPSRSLLSRLTDHYLQIIANCAPIGFEAEFVNDRGANTLYRGILMPLSSDGDTIDYIYGVINWKEVADPDTAKGIAQQACRAAAADANAIWADGPSAALEAFADGPLAEAASELEDQHAFDLPLGPDAALADRLCAARETAEAVKSADARSRSALYHALGHAYDFALAAEVEPEDYAEMLADAGVKAQARAPMTPVVKLVFGVGYDKARLTEYAAALSHARRGDVPAGAFTSFLESFSGGLKGVVQAERKARRPEPKPDAADAARAALREARPVAFIPGDGGTEEFVLLIARREADGRLAVVAPVDGDQGLVDRAIRKTAA